MILSICGLASACLPIEQWNDSWQKHMRKQHLRDTTSEHELPDGQVTYL